MACRSKPIFGLSSSASNSWPVRYSGLPSSMIATSHEARTPRRFASATNPAERPVLMCAMWMCPPVYSAADIHADPHFRERGLLVEHTDEVHGRVTVPGIVPKLSGTPGTIRQAARWTVGADTDAVLEELGVGRDERAELRAEGVV